MTVTASYDYSAIKRKDTSASPTAVYVNGTQCYRMKVNGTDVIHKTLACSGGNIDLFFGFDVQLSGYTETGSCNDSWDVTAIESATVYVWARCTDLPSGYNLYMGTASADNVSCSTSGYRLWSETEVKLDIGDTVVAPCKSYYCPEETFIKLTSSYQQLYSFKVTNIDTRETGPDDGKPGIHIGCYFKCWMLPEGVNTLNEYIEYTGDDNRTPMYTTVWLQDTPLYKGTNVTGSRYLWSSNVTKTGAGNFDDEGDVREY